jgi:hypothetical protein
LAEQVVNITDLRSLTLTCHNCGIAFRFELLLISPLRARCPDCDVEWADAGLVLSLCNSLASLRSRDNPHPRVSFLIPAREV